ncbi:MAG TPA: 30S ribosomal protein S1, partial [Prolixibacteraceae bacterium]|nr:30S ribosomal protein S1 [Prolixibacteraceae bacterium]
FATPRHLTKEDGSSVKVEDKLPFKVIEFSKSAKRIILSHSRVWEDVKRADEKDTKKSQAQQTAKAMKNVSDNIEVTTLGDISELAALKSQMEKEEKAKK